MLCNFQHPPGAEARSFIASREDGLDSRLRLTCLAAIRDGGGLAGKTTSPTRPSEGARLEYLEDLGVLDRYSS
jgi:hypothetical protein